MAHDLKEICDHLKSRGIECRHAVASQYIFTTHQLGEFKVEVRAEFPDDFPCSLPSFHLVDRLKYGALAHVAWSEGDYADICYGTKDTFSTDFHDPNLVAWAALKKAVSILEKSLKDEAYNREELIREFAGVWRFHCKSKKKRIVCLAEPTDNICELTIRSEIQKSSSVLGEYFFATCSENNSCNATNYFSSSFKAKGRRAKGKGVLVPIKPLLEPPFPNQNISNWWIEQLQVLPELVRSDLKKLSRRRKSREFYIICNAVVGSDIIWFAIKCVSNTRKNVPVRPSKVTGWSLEAINLDVISKDILVPRGGGYTGLNDCKVCLVGCGSIGSYIADMFASSGTGYLTLIDDDSYQIENLYRHQLPATALFGSKVGMLKMTLESKYPFLSVETEKKKVLQIKEASFYKQFDIIVMAIGSPSHERRFNEFLRENTIETPVVYTWVEPYGVGGHAIAVLPGKRGCLACAFIDNESDEPALHPNVSFIQTGQKILESIGGCGTEFIAFSSTDAVQTAVIATKLAIRVINGEVVESTVVSWKGKSDMASKKIISLTHRYWHLKSSMDDLPLSRESCVVCNG